MPNQRPFFYFMKTRPNTSYTETPIRVAILIDGGYFIKRYNAMYNNIIRKMQRKNSSFPFITPLLKWNCPAYNMLGFFVPLPKIKNHGRKQIRPRIDQRADKKGRQKERRMLVRLYILYDIRVFL